jgi:hypothetical protein
MNKDDFELAMKALENASGKWYRERKSFAVDFSDIRRWAIGVNWPESPPKIFVDEEHANKSKWGKNIAPREFNPFAWPVQSDDLNGGLDIGLIPNLRSMAGGTRDIYGEQIYVGDIISERSRVSEYKLTKTRLGKTLFVINESQWNNQENQFVRSRFSTGVRY